MFLSIVNNKMCHYLKPRALPLIFSACPEGWNDYDGNQCLHLTEKKDKRVNTFFFTFSLFRVQNTNRLLIALTCNCSLRNSASTRCWRGNGFDPLLLPCHSYRQWKIVIFYCFYDSTSVQLKGWLSVIVCI